LQLTHTRKEKDKRGNNTGLPVSTATRKAISVAVSKAAERIWKERGAEKKKMTRGAFPSGCAAR